MTSKKPILVLGSHGMLGQSVCAYFSNQGFEVIPVRERFEEKTKWDFLQTINTRENAVIINCIGKIKQKTEDEKDLIWANSTLPLALRDYLKPSITLIHPSTDCVFDGLTNEPYKINAIQNAKDSYGWSKRLSETALKGRPNTFILRVSIIGPDHNTSGRGLLAWFLSNKANSQLKGFTNHLWNGITTLEWCKQVEKMVMTNAFESPCQIVQLGTREFHSKYQLLLLFQKYYHTRFSIEAFESDQKVDRRLEPVTVCKPFEVQLQELTSYPIRSDQQ